MTTTPENLLNDRDPDLDPEEFERDMTARLRATYGLPPGEWPAVVVTLGGRGLLGRRVEATLTGGPVRQDVVGFRHRGRGWAVLVQDSPVRGEPSADGERLRALLRDTFVRE